MDLRTPKGDKIADFHRRNAAAMRRLAKTETRKIWRTKLLADAVAAERIADRLC